MNEKEEFIKIIDKLSDIEKKQKYVCVFDVSKIEPPSEIGCLIATILSILYFGGMLLLCYLTTKGII